MVSYGIYCGNCEDKNKERGRAFTVQVFHTHSRYNNADRKSTILAFKKSSRTHVKKL